MTHQAEHDVLRLIRLRARLRGVDIAEVLGVDKTIVSRIESGIRTTSRAEFNLWLDACEATDDERKRAEDARTRAVVASLHPEDVEAIMARAGEE